MSNEVMQVVSVKLPPEQVERVDAVVSALGGNRSEFIRLAVDERLQRLMPAVMMLTAEKASA